MNKFSIINSAISLLIEYVWFIMAIVIYIGLEMNRRSEKKELITTKIYRKIRGIFNK